VITYSTQ